MVSVDEEKYQWFFIDKNIEDEKDKVKGPMSVRDLDVLYRTNIIDSTTFVFKDGMGEWKQIYQVDLLKKHLMDANFESQQVQQLKEGKINTIQMSNPIIQQINPIVPIQPLQNSDSENSEDELLKTFNENPEKALEIQVDKMIKTKYYKDPITNNWKIYDEREKSWKTQKQEPTEQIQLLREDLLKTFKKEFLNKDIGKGIKKQKSVLPKKERDLTGLTVDQLKKIEKNRKKTEKQKEKKKIKNIEKLSQTYIYISGLPKDVTEDEINEFFSKAGMIRFDPQTGNRKIKIYQDDQNFCNGEAMISFQKLESVKIAKDMLDGGYIRQDSKIRVEQAKFQEKEGGLANLLKKKQKLDKVQIMRMKQLEQKGMGWEEQDQVQGLKIVVIRGLFTLDDLQNGPEDFFPCLQEEMMEECSKVGPVQRIKVYENNPNGYIQVKFADCESAEKCIEVMDGRFFDGRQLECYYYDGETDFNKTSDCKIDEEQRIEEFGKFLEQD